MSSTGIRSPARTSWAPGQHGIVSDSRLPHQTLRAVSSAAAVAYGGVISRRELRVLGVDRHVVSRAIRAGHWAAHGTQTVAVHTRPLTQGEHWWRAVWEVGIEVAALDGVSALMCAGLTGFSDDLVHVSVVHFRTPHPPGTGVHGIIRRLIDEVVGSGFRGFERRLPRFGPPSGRYRTGRPPSCLP